MRGKWLQATVAILMGLLIGVPILWVIFSSFKPSADIAASPFKLPTAPATQNYSSAWSEAKIGRSMLNSALVSIVSLAILLPIGSMAAYVLSRLQFKGRGFIAVLFNIGLMFPNFLAVIPLFLLFSQLNIVDTLYGLVIAYVAYSLSFTVFVMSGFFKALPNELEQAAELDGCTYSKTFWKVMLPLAKPGLVVAGLFNLIGLWNEYSLAKVLVSGDNSTLPVGLANLTIAQFYKNDYGALFAALTIVMVPIVIVYWIFKDKVHDAMLAGSLK